MKTLLQYAALIIGLLGVVHAAEVDEPVLAKIAVKSDGSIYYDDRRIEFRDLDRLLTLIQGKPGVVWFRITPSRGELHPVVKDVGSLLVAKRISFRPHPRDDLPPWVGSGASPYRTRRN